MMLQRRLHTGSFQVEPTTLQGKRLPSEDGGQKLVACSCMAIESITSTVTGQLLCAPACKPHLQVLLHKLAVSREVTSNDPDFHTWVSCKAGSQVNNLQHPRISMQKTSTKFTYSCGTYIRNLWLYVSHVHGCINHLGT